MSTKSFVTIVLIFIRVQSFSQHLTIQNFETNSKGIVEITCLLEAHHSLREEYELSLFSSLDGYQKPLPIDNVIIKPGIAKLISFNGNEIIGDYEGEIDFQCKIKPKVFPIQVRLKEDKLKKGKEITLEWVDFHNVGVYRVEIYRNSTLFSVLAESHDQLSLTTRMSKKLPKGEYELRVSPLGNELYASDYYSINMSSGRTGLVVGAGGAIAVGAGVLLIGSGKNDTGTNDLPGVPAMPDN